MSSFSLSVLSSNFESSALSFALDSFTLNALKDSIIGSSVFSPFKVKKTKKQKKKEKRKPSL
jgi:hypothetical protein